MTEKHNENEKQLDVQDLIRQHPADIAEIMSALSEDEANILLARLGQKGDLVAELLEEMEPADAARLLEGMNRQEAVRTLSRMAPDDAVDLLAELPPDTIQDILGRLDSRESHTLEELLRYPENTAGSLMSPEVVALPLHLTVQQAIEVLRQKAEEAETIYYAYVTDDNRKLLGVLQLRDLVTARPNKPIADIMRREVFTLRATDSVDEVIKAFDKFHFIALPVLDEWGHLHGIITMDDAMANLRREDTEDILRMGGIPGGDEHPLSRPGVSIRNRLPWMLLNMLLNLVAVTGVAVFEASIAKVAFLAVLMPIISDMGGNVASQAMAVAIRGMAVGKAQWSDVGRILRKEFIVGFVVGLVLGLEISLITYIWRGNIYLGVVAAMAIWINTMLSTVIGAGFPFLARRFGMDPAMMSGAVVTTITDMSGFFLFLGLATAWLVYL